MESDGQPVVVLTIADTNQGSVDIRQGNIQGSLKGQKHFVSDSACDCSSQGDDVA